MAEDEREKLNMDTVTLKENLKKMELKRDEYVFDVKGYNQKRNVKRVLIGKHAYTLNKLFEDEDEEESEDDENVKRRRRIEGVGVKGGVGGKERTGVRGVAAKGGISVRRGAKEGIGVKGGVGAKEGIGVKGGVGAKKGIGVKGGVGAKEGIGVKGGVGAKEGIGVKGGVGAKKGIGVKGGRKVKGERGAKEEEEDFDLRRSSSLLLEKYEEHNLNQFRRLFFDYKKTRVRHKRRRHKRAKQANLDTDVHLTKVLQQKILDEDLVKDTEPEPIVPVTPVDVQTKEEAKALKDIRNEMKTITQPGYVDKRKKAKKEKKLKSKEKKAREAQKKMSMPHPGKGKFIIKKIMDRKSTFKKEKKPFLKLIDEENKIEITEGMIDLIEKLYDPELRTGSIDTMSIHSGSLRDLIGEERARKQRIEKKRKVLRLQDELKMPKREDLLIKEPEEVIHAEEIPSAEKESSTLFVPIPSSELELRKESSELFVPVKPTKRKPTEKIGEGEEIKEQEEPVETKTFDLRRREEYRYAEFFKYAIYAIPKRHPSGFSFSGFCLHCQNFQPCAEMPCPELKRSLPDFKERARRLCCKKWNEGNIPIPHPSGMTFTDFRFKY